MRRRLKPWIWILAIFPLVAAADYLSSPWRGLLMGFSLSVAVLLARRWPA